MEDNWNSYRPAISRPRMDYPGVNRNGKAIRKSPPTFPQPTPAAGISHHHHHHHSVYHIHRSDFRRIVQQLTGSSPPHHGNPSPSRTAMAQRRNEMSYLSPEPPMTPPFPPAPQLSCSQDGSGVGDCSRLRRPPLSVPLPTLPAPAAFSSSGQAEGVEAGELPADMYLLSPLSQSLLDLLYSPRDI